MFLSAASVVSNKMISDGPCFCFSFPYLFTGKFRIQVLFNVFLLGKNKPKTVKVFGKRRTDPKKVIGRTLCLSHSKVDRSDVLSSWQHVETLDSCNELVVCK